MPLVSCYSSVLCTFVFLVHRSPVIEFLSSSPLIRLLSVRQKTIRREMQEVLHACTLKHWVSTFTNNNTYLSPLDCCTFNLPLPVSLLVIYAALLLQLLRLYHPSSNWPIPPSHYPFNLINNLINNPTLVWDLSIHSVRS